ncbi:hypothetical protein DL93DRAFT_2174396 [Clavulina sp. PMI_390]|nr:hypothetical protein DL93DRAFT_2174396 [Clavulina sp. PMI_390]
MTSSLSRHLDMSRMTWMYFCTAAASSYPLHDRATDAKLTATSNQRLPPSTRTDAKNPLRTPSQTTAVACATPSGVAASLWLFLINRDDAKPSRLPCPERLHETPTTKSTATAPPDTPYRSTIATHATPSGIAALLWSFFSNNDYSQRLRPRDCLERAHHAPTASSTTSSSPIAASFTTIATHDTPAASLTTPTPPIASPSTTTVTHAMSSGIAALLCLFFINNHNMLHPTNPRPPQMSTRHLRQVIYPHQPDLLPHCDHLLAAQQRFGGIGAHIARCQPDCRSASAGCSDAFLRVFSFLSSSPNTPLSSPMILLPFKRSWTQISDAEAAGATPKQYLTGLAGLR